MAPKTSVETAFDMIWRIGLRIALLIGLGYFLYRVRSVLVTIMLAAVVTYALLPIVDFLCSRRIKGLGYKVQRFGATLLVFIALAFLVIFLFRAFFLPLQNEVNGLAANSNTYVQGLSKLATSAQKWYTGLHPDLQSFLKPQNFQGIFDKVGKWSTSVLSSTIDFLRYLPDLILIPVLAFYFTLDSRSLKKEFVGLVPRRRTRESLAIVREINCIMRSYVLGQLILCVIAGLIVSLILNFAHMQYGLTLSVFAGITRAVPVIGPIVSGVVIVLLGTVKSVETGAFLLITFCLLQFVESKFIMPKLIGDRMKLHPALIIVVLLIGAEFFGIFGMFMAAPVAAIVRVLVRFYLIKPKQIGVWGLTHQMQASISRETAHDTIVITEEDAETAQAG
jgi:predicted PurR-regulated permease PerM